MADLDDSGGPDSLLLCERDVNSTAKLFIPPRFRPLSDTNRPARPDHRCTGPMPFGLDFPPSFTGTSLHERFERTHHDLRRFDDKQEPFVQTSEPVRRTSEIEEITNLYLIHPAGG